ncbi:MAG: hypothetical protein Q8L14_42160 [Myxococcales bacterium]|nr:hypothetical protein [Myxococcales bacterium]
MSGTRIIVAGLVACLGGCEPQAPAPMEPKAPTLDVPASSSDDPWRVPTLTLRAVADDDTVVQLFVSADCSGPELLRRPIEAFRDGVELDAVSGTNVFSAAALTRSGLRSRCSAAASVEVRLPMRGSTSAPDVRGISPSMPTKLRLAKLTGFARPGWTVRIWSKPDCDGVVLASGPAADFVNEPGLEVPLPLDGHYDVSLDGVRGFELTRCGNATTRLENDVTPPVFQARFFPRPPHAFDVSAIVVPDLERGAVVQMRPGDSCVGTDLRVVGSSFCTDERCGWVLFPLPPAETLSLLVTDRAGNDGACLTLVQQAAPEGVPPMSPLWTWVTSRHVVLAGPDTLFAELYAQPNCAGGSTQATVANFKSGLAVFVVETSGRSTQSARFIESPTGTFFPCVSVAE